MIKIERAPLSAKSDGEVRVGVVRVTLDTIVTVFNQGKTAEEIVCCYLSLKYCCNMGYQRLFCIIST